MRVLLAFDKFKDALTAREACAVAATALGKTHPDWSFDLCPLTDGGEGFCSILGEAASAQRETVAVCGPTGQEVAAEFYRVAGASLPEKLQASFQVRGPRVLGLVETAAASGLGLVPPNQRDPWHTTSFGTGQILAAARETDALLLGIGGSATNDLGCGALAALGFDFIAASGGRIHRPVPATWDKIVRIERTRKLRLPPIFIACDVTNPLLGSQGATAIFGPQKGLKPEEIPQLESEVARMTEMLLSACGQHQALAGMAGAGAAGGLGFGLMAAYGAWLVPGFELVSDWLNISGRLAAADLLITGEGRFDATSLAGKGPGRLVAEAQRLGKPCHIFAGSLGLPSQPHLHAITPDAMPLNEALVRAAELLAAALNRPW